MTEPISTVRTTPGLPVELIAICQSRHGIEGLKLSATISVYDGKRNELKRQVFPCGDTLAGFQNGYRQIEAWIASEWRAQSQRAKYRSLKLYDFSTADYSAEVVTRWF